MIATDVLGEVERDQDTYPHTYKSRPLCLHLQLQLPSSLPILGVSPALGTRKIYSICPDLAVRLYYLQVLHFNPNKLTKKERKKERTNERTKERKKTAAAAANHCTFATPRLLQQARNALACPRSCAGAKATNVTLHICIFCEKQKSQQYLTYLLPLSLCVGVI